MVRVTTVGDEALVIVDSNGDGAEFEGEIWRRFPGGWVEMGGTNVGGGTWRGWRGGLVWTVGQAEGCSRVRLEIGDDVQDLDVDADGFWVLAQENGTPLEAVPRVVDYLRG